MGRHQPGDPAAGQSKGIQPEKGPAMEKGYIAGPFACLSMRRYTAFSRQMCRIRMRISTISTGARAISATVSATDAGESGTR